MTPKCIDLERGKLKNTEIWISCICFLSKWTDCCLMLLFLKTLFLFEDVFSLHLDGTVKMLASWSNLWRTQPQEASHLTWHRTACAQPTGPCFMSTHDRKTDGLLTDSLSRWDSRLYVNWAMFRGFGCCLAWGWLASSLRNMRVHAQGKESLFKTSIPPLFNCCSWSPCYSLIK